VRWRSAIALAALGLGLAAVGAGELRAGESEPSASLVPAGGALRDYVTASLDAELAVLARTRATIDDKLAVAGGQRRRRVRAAYELLRGGAAPAWIDPAERMATARRRAAARWLLARDRSEQALLAEESASLAAAHARLVVDRSLAAIVPLPPAGLDRPVEHRMTIARHFGAFVHERSKATLTRRGLDVDVPADADVRPVAAGTVLYAGPIRGLDDGVVIDHGGWLSVTAELAPTTLHRGDRVARGDLLGHAAHRRVYLEVRVAVGPGGIPVDPEPLLRK